MIKRRPFSFEYSFQMQGKEVGEAVDNDRNSEPIDTLFQPTTSAIQKERPAFEAFELYIGLERLRQCEYICTACR
jgi:hypothetical protein